MYERTSLNSIIVAVWRDKRRWAAALATAAVSVGHTRVAATPATPATSHHYEVFNFDCFRLLSFSSGAGMNTLIHDIIFSFFCMALSFSIFFSKKNIHNSVAATISE